MGAMVQAVEGEVMREWVTHAYHEGCCVHLIPSMEERIRTVLETKDKSEHEIRLRLLRKLTPTEVEDLPKGFRDMVLETDVLWAKGNALLAKGNALLAKGNALCRKADAIWHEGLLAKGNALCRKADAIWEEGDALRAKGNALCRKADAFWDEGDALQRKAITDYRAELDAWHAKHCGCKEWDGWRIRF